MDWELLDLEEAEPFVDETQRADRRRMRSEMQQRVPGVIMAIMCLECLLRALVRLAWIAVQAISRRWFGTRAASVRHEVDIRDGAALQDEIALARPAGPTVTMPPQPNS